MTIYDASLPLMTIHADSKYNFFVVDNVFVNIVGIVAVVDKEMSSCGLHLLVSIL